MYLADEVSVIEELAVVMIDVLTEVMLDIIVAATAVIDLEFAVVAACGVDVLTGVWDATTIGVVAAIGVDVLADMNVNGFTAVMTALDFVLPAP